MANCPNCNRKLHFWNVKAECPDCGTDIPNYDWEKRLAEDAAIRDENFFKLHTTLHKLKFATIGNKVRIARLVCAFLPVIGYVLPLASLNIKTSAGVESDLGGLSLISIFTNKSIALGDLFSMLSNADTKTAGIYGVLSLGFLFLSLLLGVIAFFLIPIMLKRPKSPIQAILHALSIPLYALSPFILSRFCAEYAAAGLGTAQSSYGWGIYIGAALFVVAFILDIIVATKPIDEKEIKYVPTETFERKYAISIGAITEDEMPA